MAIFLYFQKVSGKDNVGDMQLLLCVLEMLLGTSVALPELCQIFITLASIS
jgi:hypothetical protein